MIAVKQYYKSLEYVQSQKETLEPVLLAVLLDNMTKKQYLEICRIAIVNNGNALKYVKSDNMSDKQYLEICKLAVQKDGNALYKKSGDQSGGANTNYSYNYYEFFKLMKKESENLKMFNLYKMILNKIINEYNKNNKIDEFEAILYGALATGQDPSKVPILFEILKISILDKDKQTILLSYNKKKRIKMLNKYSNKDVLTQIEQKIKYFYDHYKKEVAYIEQRILKLKYEYRNKLLTFDNPEKIIYILNNLVDDNIKELFDNSDLYDLYPLNMSNLKQYIMRMTHE